MSEATPTKVKGPRIFSKAWFVGLFTVVKIWKYSAREHCIAMLSTQITLAQLAFGEKLLVFLSAKLGWVVPLLKAVWGKFVGLVVATWQVATHG